MATYYTNKIIDGEITTVEDFVKICAGEFGVTIDVGDIGTEPKYVPKKVDSFYGVRIEECKRKLDELGEMSDEEIIANREEELQHGIEICRNKIRLAEKNATTLVNFIKEIFDWDPPTKEHYKLKEFMINQLHDTIKHDCDIEHFRYNLSELYQESFTLDAENIRKTLMTKINDDLKYYVELFERETNRATETNIWAEQLLNSFDKKK